MTTELGTVAYQAYGDSTGWKTHDGQDMPLWADLGERIQAAWHAAATAVLAHRQDELPVLVRYILTEQDATVIQQRRAKAGTTANMVGAGRTYPAVIVGTFTAPLSVNLQVLLDGPDTYWATSRAEGREPGCWSRTK